jgi:hypothetical protein
MKKETCDQFLNVADDIFRTVGKPSFVEGMSWVCVKLGELLHLLEYMSSKSKVERFLAEIPEPDPEEAKQTLAVLRKLPIELRKIMPEALKRIAKILPHEPGGRPVALTPKDRKEVCKKIGSLLAVGLSLRDAQSRVARQKGVSLRTTQRVWQSRKQLMLPEGT